MSSNNFMPGFFCKNTASTTVVIDAAIF